MELLIVVAMIGVLSALAIVGYRKYINSSHSGEAKAIITAIRAGEESYRAETLLYLGCSGCNGAPCVQGAGNLTSRYPRTLAMGPADHDQKWNWVQPLNAEYPCWKMLNVTADGPVRYTYSVVSGAPGQVPPNIPSWNGTQPTWPNPTQESWYVVQALGNIDGDSVPSNFAASSFTGEVAVENESE